MSMGMQKDYGGGRWGERGGFGCLGRVLRGLSGTMGGSEQTLWGGGWPWGRLEGSGGTGEGSVGLGRGYGAAEVGAAAVPPPPGRTLGAPPQPRSRPFLLQHPARGCPPPRPAHVSYGGGGDRGHCGGHPLCGWGSWHPPRACVVPHRAPSVKRTICRRCCSLLLPGAGGCLRLRGRCHPLRGTGDSQRCPWGRGREVVGRG